MAGDGFVRIVKKSSLRAQDSAQADLEYWLSRTVDERFAAVEFFRKQVYGDYSERLQRVSRITQRPRR